MSNNVSLDVYNEMRKGGFLRRIAAHQKALSFAPGNAEDLRRHGRRVAVPGILERSGELSVEL